MPRAPCLGSRALFDRDAMCLQMCHHLVRGLAEVRKHEILAAGGLGGLAVNHSTLSASRGRTLIFWLPNCNEVRGALPPPGSDTLTSMPNNSAVPLGGHCDVRDVDHEMIEGFDLDRHALSFRR